MKKRIFSAVAATIVALCAVMFTGCEDIAGEKYSSDNRVAPEVKTARLVHCIVPRIDYTTTGVVETRAYSGVPEGSLDVTSYHEFVALYGTDTVRHTYTGRFIVNAFDVKKVRYAHNSDIFKNPVVTPSVLADGRTLNVVTFKDTETHDFDIALVEELPIYEQDTYQVGDSIFKLCKNERILLELIDSKVEPTTSPDEKYNAYTVALYFQYGLSEGPDNKKTFLIRLPQVLVPKAGPNEPIPGDKHDVIAFEDKDKGYDLVNDSINNRWIDIVKVLSDGSREPFPRVAFVSKNHLFAPAYQVKNVDDFDWQSQTMKSFDATPSGDWQKRENNIFVMPMTQSCATYTDKGTCVFTGDFDGQAYFVDSLNQKHYFLYKEYEFEDDGWQRGDMSPTENYERKLLTSNIRGLFNGATLARKGEIELRMLKGANIEIVGFWYSPLDSDESGLKPIQPNSTYWTWRTQYLLFSDGSKEKVGEVGTTLNLATVVPEKQVVTVTDWEISDLSAQGYNATRNSSRTDKIETGTFTIQSWSKKYVTRTNKSSDDFVTTYDGTVTFKDKYGQEVEFLALAVKQEDKGGVATMKSLPEADNMERKSMTTTIAVTETNTSTSANHTAEIEFRKAKPEAPKVVSYAYENFGIKPVVPNKQYFTYCTRYAVKSDNTRENLGTFGTDLYVNVTEPAKQTITVQDWNINDLSAMLGTEVAKGNREDNQTQGVFKISKSEKSYTTKTNKSECKFVIEYEGTVIFTDEFGTEVPFKGITIDTKDLGGVKTLKDLAEADDMERKEMTSTITVSVNSTDNANYNGVVEFRKAVEKEELTEWKVTDQDLVYNGNGNWTSTTTVTYDWKLAGPKTETYSTGLVWNILGEPKAQVILDEAKADYKTLNAGSETSSASANGNITVVTKKKGYTEDYTTLKDNYTATMQTASYKSTVGGKTIAFDFLSPTGMTVAHADGSLVNGNRTTTKNGTEYDVWDHTGSVTATVVSPKGNQTETATDEKEVLIEKVIFPAHPEWGNPVRIIGRGSVIYRPGVGPNGQGVFYCGFNVLYEKGVLCVRTNSYITAKQTNPQDFSYDEKADFYPWGSKLRGFVLKENNPHITDGTSGLNSQIWRDNKFEPACCTYEPGKGVWTYMSPDQREQGMTENLAETCGLKHFTGTNTAHLQPWLYYTSTIQNGVLVIKNSWGGAVLKLR